MSQKPDARKDQSLQITESELTIMQTIWQIRGPVSVQEVHDHLQKTEGWKYNTVATFMMRLVNKGFLSLDRQGGPGRTRLFSAEVSEEAYLEDHLRQTLKRQFRGSNKAFFAAYLAQEKLDQDEIDTLRDWLEKQ